MSIFISHSQIYGTEDWFDGEPSVYNINEAEAFCAPISTACYWRNYFPNANVSGNIELSDNPESGFDDLSNMTASLVTSKTRTGGLPHNVVSSATHIYWIDPGSNDVGEYDIETGSTYVFTTDLPTTHISLVQDRKVVVVLNDQANWRYQIRLYDFETETYETIYTKEREETDGTTYNTAETIYSVVSIESGSSVLSMFIYWRFRYGWSSPDPVDLYCDVDVYNHSTEDLDTYIVRGTSQDSVENVNSALWYYPPVMLNGKLVWSFRYDGVRDAASNVYLNEAPYFIFDIATRNLSVAIDIAPGFRNQGCFRMAAHETNNKVYILAEFHSNDYMMHYGYLDMDTLTFTWLAGGITSGYTGGFIQGRDKCYYYVSSGTTYFRVYDPEDIVNHLLSINPGVYIDQYTKLCTNLDEVGNKFWYWRSTSIIRSYVIDTGATEDISVSVPNAAVSPTRHHLSLQGDKMLVVIYRRTTNVTDLYLVRNVEAE
jgi:hypothetical protein